MRPGTRWKRRSDQERTARRLRTIATLQAEVRDAESRIADSFKRYRRVVVYRDVTPEHLGEVVGTFRGVPVFRENFIELLQRKRDEFWPRAAPEAHAQYTEMFTDLADLLHPSR